MAAPRWARVKEVLGTALDLGPAARAAFLDEACAGDADLRMEVDSLISAEQASGDFIVEPVVRAPAGVAAERPAGTDPDNIGRALGPYVIERCLGHGGMGTVYLAHRADREFERLVAIKMIRGGMDSELVVRRFRHERQILATLDHPHIAALFDGGTTPDGLPYFVMEYVAGTPIDRYADERRLNTAERVRLCLGVIDAVQHAHDHHVVHRDLKPSNVLVTAEGHPKLLDFGIAKILEPGTDGASTFTAVAGAAMTPDYASPEQVLGRPVTAASDVYALGLLLYELLTGHRPYRLTTHAPEELVRVVCEQDPERPSDVIQRVDTVTQPDGTTTTTSPATVSETREGSPALLRKRLHGALDDVVLKALRKEPEQRYASAAALGEDLRRYLADEPVAAGQGAGRYRAARWARRHRTALSAAALAIGAAGLTAFLAGAFRPEISAVAGAPVEASAPSSPRPSLAVVGFRNLSQRPADEWLSTALAEMLTTELAGDGQLRVVPADQVARAERDAGTDAGRLSANLATDYVVQGTFAVIEGTPSHAVRAVRIDVRVQRPSRDPIAVSSVADEAQVFSTVADAGRQLRIHLGLRESPVETINGARAAFPQSLEANRLYAEGAARLRRLDAVAARDLLERAAALEPGSPLIQTTLASAWTALGYDARAEAAARQAFETSRALNREDRLNVEGRLHEATRQWPKAVETYRTLWGFFSDNIEYGLRLAAAQTSGGMGKDALATVEEMRRLPAPQRADPRIDLAEAQAATTLSDYARELDALRRTLQSAEKSGSRMLMARARLLEGRSYFNQGQPGPAEKAIEASRRLFEEAGDRAGLASALNSLATVLGDQESRPRIQRLYEESLAISSEIGDRRSMSAALNNLGIMFKDERRFVEAMQAHERALAIRRDIGDRNWTAISLSNIGVVLFEQDRLQDAAKYYEESLAIARDIGDKRQQVRALHNLAIVSREAGRLAEARAEYEESLATRAEIGDKRGQAIGKVELGAVLLAQGELERARQVEEEAVQLARETKLTPGEAQAEYQLGEIAIARGDLAAGRRHHARGLTLRLEMNETRTVLESRLALAELALEEGQPAEAERGAQQVDQALGSEPSGPLRVQVGLLTARAHLARGAVEAAAGALATARRFAEGTERVEVRRKLAMVEAEYDAARGRTQEARTRLAALRPVLQRAGMVLADFERRLFLLGLDRAEELSTVKVDANALARDAQARGAGLIVTRVQARSRS